MYKCSNCGDSFRKHRYVVLHNVCTTCRRYFLSTGNNRIKKRGFSSKKDVVCSNCKRKYAVRKGLCSSCHQYDRVNNKPRPYRKLERKVFCINCGIHKDSQYKRGLVRNRCHSCVMHLYRTGKERPKRFWSTVERWCGCGNPASHHDVELKTSMHGNHNALPDKVVGVFFDYDLCGTCYNLEFDNQETR
jgi:hypothetical protein